MSTHDRHVRASVHMGMFSFMLSAEGQISPNWGDASHDFLTRNGINRNLHSDDNFPG